jgi:hypothetical protein
VTRPAVLAVVVEAAKGVSSVMGIPLWWSSSRCLMEWRTLLALIVMMHHPPAMK